MSSAFVREGDDEWLSDIGPSLKALSFFLTRENNGIEVYEVKNFVDSKGDEVHVMSNGLSYKKDANGKWDVADLTE
jgi:hypothetical protein